VNQNGERPAFARPGVARVKSPGTGDTELAIAHDGMTLREWYAGLFFAAILTRSTYTPADGCLDEAVGFADKLTARLDASKGGEA
jgi:hypothetical protein